MNYTKTAIAVLALSMVAACDPAPTSNDLQREQSERMLQEGQSQIGMPAIKNFRERKLLKDIYEMRDQSGLVTYTYLWNEFNGKMVFFCNSIGYAIPYATQFTAGESVQRFLVARSGDVPRAFGTEKLPQAEPNGLFQPASAEASWVLCKDPNGDAVRPTYVEPRIIVSQFKLAQ